MIISLSPSFDTFEVDDWTPYIASIEHLLTAHLAGWHIFVPSRAALRSLVRVGSFSERHRTALDVYIAQRIASLQGQASSVSKKIVCHADGETMSDMVGIVSVKLSAFSDIENCFRSVLLVENASTDGKFYVALAQALSSQGQTALPLSFDFANGGGSTTGAQLRRLAAVQRPVLAIVDSDKDHPDDRPGDTARQAISAYEDHVTSRLHQLVVIPVRAVENFVPPKLGAHFLKGRPQSVEITEALATLHDVEASQGFDPLQSALCYINMKRGLKMKAYRTGNPVFRSSVISLLGLLGLAVELPADNDNRRDGEAMIPSVNNRYIELFTEALESQDFLLRCREEFGRSPFAVPFGALLNEVVAYGLNAGRTPIVAGAAA